MLLSTVDTTRVTRTWRILMGREATKLTKGRMGARGLSMSELLTLETTHLAYGGTLVATQNKLL